MYELGFEPGFPGARLTLVAQAAVGLGITAIAAANNRRDLWKQRAQCSDRRRLSGAAITEHEDTTHARIDGRDQNGQFHVILTDNRRKRKGCAHADPNKMMETAIVDLFYISYMIYVIFNLHTAM
jgi:hypothetical protein